VFVNDRARFSGVTLPAGWMILPRMDERALIRSGDHSATVDPGELPAGAGAGEAARMARAGSVEQAGGDAGALPHP
jgi:hypothetical protein